VHNKLKPKKGVLPDDVTYIVGENVPNVWNCYPWDAHAYGRDIDAHEALARGCAGEMADAMSRPTTTPATAGDGSGGGRDGSVGVGWAEVCMNLPTVGAIAAAAFGTGYLWNNSR
jgi:hypothetical protein